MAIQKKSKIKIYRLFTHESLFAWFLAGLLLLYIENESFECYSFGHCTDVTMVPKLYKFYKIKCWKLYILLSFGHIYSQKCPHPCKKQLLIFTLNYVIMNTFSVSVFFSFSARIFGNPYVLLFYQLLWIQYFKFIITFNTFNTFWLIFSCTWGQ